MTHDPDFEKLVESVLANIREISTDEVSQTFAQKEYLLIDVREKEEWDQGYIPGAIHIGKGVIERDISKHVFDKNQELVLYCGGGYRSALAADNLQKMGYRQVKSMSGGIREWKDRNFPLKRD